MKVRPRPPRFQRPEPEPYQDYRQPLQARWRPFILDRDKGKCRSCGVTEKKAGEPLHMAHITDCSAFVKAAGTKEAVTFSFRWDNLMMLCAECHRASHRYKWNDDELERRLAVSDLEADLRRLRGWSSPFAVLPPHMVPKGHKLTASFHDRLRISPLVPFPTFPKYAADGGIVWRNKETGPDQSALPLEG